MNAPATPMSSDDALEELSTVHTRIVDAIAGYRTMHEKSEPRFQTVVSDLITTHEKHRDELGALLARHGRTPDAEGSFMSKIHETVVKARALFGEIDEDAAGQIVRVEEWIIDGYGEALEEGLSAEDGEIIARQRGTLRQSVATLRMIDD